jgi:hypothetical protein
MASGSDLDLKLYVWTTLLAVGPSSLHRAGADDRLHPGAIQANDAPSQRILMQSCTQRFRIDFCCRLSECVHRVTTPLYLSTPSTTLSETPAVYYNSWVAMQYV